MAAARFNIIQRYIYLKTVASTNLFLADYVSKNNPLAKIAVYSFHQTEGTGQIGRKWFSGVNKNISLSLYLPLAQLEAIQHFKLNMAIALSLKEWLLAQIPNLDVSLKWPNDIYIGNKKIAGLLIQNQIRSSKIINSIIGVGLNVLETDFPQDIPNATSLINLNNRDYNLESLSVQLAQHIAEHTENKLSDSYNLKQNYLSSLYGLNQTRQYIINENQEVEGIIKEIDDHGYLKILIQGKLHSFNHHQIEFVIS